MEPRYLLARVLLALDRRPDAVWHLEEVVRREPKSAGPYVDLGRAYFKMGRKTDAEAKLEKALQVSPGHPEARQLLGVIRRGS